MKTKYGLCEKAFQGASLCNCTANDCEWIYTLYRFRDHWFRLTSGGKLECIDENDKDFLNLETK